MEKISAVLLTGGERERIEPCLRSLAWADEIVVVDTGPGERTLERVRRYTDAVFKGDLRQGFAYNRNLGNQRARNTWIVKIDPDEVVSEQLAREICERAGSEPEIRGYYAATRTHFNGRWIRGGGWYPMPQLRVFDKRQATWKGLVHERLDLEGNTSRLANDFLHYSYDDIQHYFSKFNLYTSFEAVRLNREGRRVRWWNLPSLFFLRPGAHFLRSYLLWNGWKDGYYGFVISLYSAFYVMVKYMKLLEVQKDPEADQPSRMLGLP